MKHYLIYLLQLLLSPDAGWKDLEKASPNPDILMRKGFYPLLIVTALTELLPVIYGHSGIGKALLCAVAVAGAYFVAVFVAKLMFETYYPRTAGVQADDVRSSVFSLCAVGLMLLFQIIENVLPWNLLVLKLLPVYAIVVMSRGMKYLGVPAHSEVAVTMAAAGAVVLVPLVIYYFIFLIV